VTRIRWYLDEDAMARHLVRGLRSRGVDVLTPFEAGWVGEPDADQLRHASRLGRTLFTFNVADFCRLHAKLLGSGQYHAGIVVANRRKFRLGELVHGLARLTSERRAEQMVNQLHFLRG
jgi:Domain of unknown function (DUF5615)